jgi:hypothetical protein
MWSLTSANFSGGAGDMRAMLLLQVMRCTSSRRRFIGGHQEQALANPRVSCTGNVKNGTVHSLHRNREER